VLFEFFPKANKRNLRHIFSEFRKNTCSL